MDLFVIKHDFWKLLVYLLFTECSCKLIRNQKNNEISFGNSDCKINSLKLRCYLMWRCDPISGGAAMMKLREL